MGQCEHFGGVSVAVGRIGIREHFANIAQGGRAEQSVSDGVQQYVGIAMADEVAIVRNLDSTQPQGPPLAKSMRIVSDAHAHEYWKSLSKPASGAGLSPGEAD
jgi:hypothetical protein